jgi:hypothetical protein
MGERGPLTLGLAMARALAASVTVLAALWGFPALSQPQPPPSPWVINGNQISYGGCVTVPITVAGGCQGNGSLNVGSLFVNGVQAPSTAGTGISLSGGTISLNGTLSGVGTVFMTGVGPFVNGHCASFNSTFDVVDSGGSCGGGGGSGTVNSASANNLAYYVGAGNAVSGLTTANNGVLVTSGAGAPSISSTLPAAVQGNITALGTIGTGVWHGTLIGATYGGSGLSNPTAHSILLGEGASAFGVIPAATAGHIIVDQGSGADWLSVSVSQDCTLAATGVITCTKTNNTAFGSFATANAATPPAIGGTTPAAGAFTTLSATGNLTINVTGSTQCLQANSAGVVSGSGAACGGATPVVGGRLTAAASTCSGAIHTQFNNVPAAGFVCYSPYLNGNGNQLWINGANFTYTLLTLDLSSAICGAGSSACFVAGNLYDIIAARSGGSTVLCGDGNAWVTLTPAPGATINSPRTDPIALNANGVYQNSGTWSHCYNGATDYGPITTLTATVLGTMYINANGQTIWEPAPTPSAGTGPAAIFGLYNFYNRVVATGFVADSRGSFTYNGTNNWTKAYSSAFNRISYVDGLGFSQATFTMNYDITGESSGVAGGGVSTCMDGGANGTSPPQCPTGVNGTNYGDPFATSTTTWSLNTQVGMTGVGTTTMGSYHKRWFTLIGFHFAQAVITAQSGQTLLLTGGGTFNALQGEIPM